MGIEQLDQLGEVRERPRKTVDLVDNDDVDLAGADVLQQLLKVGAVGGPAGVPSIIIAGPDQIPAGMGLALYVRRRGIVLRIQRVELLIEPMVGGDPGIDRTADRAFMVGPPSPIDPLYLSAQRSADRSTWYR